MTVVSSEQLGGELGCVGCVAGVETSEVQPCPLKQTLRADLNVATARAALRGADLDKARLYEAAYFAWNGVRPYWLRISIERTRDTLAALDQGSCDGPKEVPRFKFSLPLVGITFGFGKVVKCQNSNAQGR